MQPGSSETNVDNLTMYLNFFLLLYNVILMPQSFVIIVILYDGNARLT